MSNDVERVENKMWDLNNGILTIFDSKCLEIEGFDCMEDITRVYLPEGVEGIIDSAFYRDYNLAEINIPSSVKLIECEAFEGCRSLKNIVLPDKLEQIGAVAFYCSGLKDITIPRSIKRIGRCAFAHCENLQRVVMKCDALTKFEDSVFLGCKNLESIQLPESIEDIPWRAFYGCESLREITVPSKCRWILACAFEDCTSLERVTIGAGIGAIRSGAFANCTNLKRVDFDGVNRQVWIQWGAFDGVPDDVTICFNGKEISLKEIFDFLEDMGDDGEYPFYLSGEVIDDVIARRITSKTLSDF